mmetsp:Transcript_30648/g.79512  ORF Transcript_30648/g.79512 Transcript_30648/m.79512 type:complete len:103 (+) Transcript_30648:103-411(+)
MASAPETMMAWLVEEAGRNGQTVGLVTVMGHTGMLICAAANSHRRHSVLACTTGEGLVVAPAKVNTVVQCAVRSISGMINHDIVLLRATARRGGYSVLFEHH